MNIRKFWLLTVVVCLSMILVFSVAGCRGEVTSKEAAKEKVVGEEKPESEETSELSEQPDKKLLDRYFSDIVLCGARGFFGGVVEENISTFLPHQKISLCVGYNSKKDFTYRIVIFDLKANDFVKRSDSVGQSLGAAGGSVTQRPFLLPGNYEHKVYIEDTLVAVLPFEVISYVDYFFGNSGEEK